jgi:hypothetical protein
MEETMAKRADHYISRVRYNAVRTHIEQLEVQEDKGGTIGNPTTWTREQVIASIDREKKVFVTIIKDVQGIYQCGEDVRVIELSGTKYLRTDANKTPKDNLGNLPEF